MSTRIITKYINHKRQIIKYKKIIYSLLNNNFNLITLFSHHKSKIIV